MLPKDAIGWASLLASIVAIVWTAGQWCRLNRELREKREIEDAALDLISHFMWGKDTKLPEPIDPERDRRRAKGAMLAASWGAIRAEWDDGKIRVSIVSKG
jgi:hypothetical protein